LRERGANVVEVGHDREAIAAAIRAQLEHGPYQMDPLYGDGRAGKRIADILAHERVAPQKRITY
jgi:UDP-N-acetylglucosamine 2-epimerase